VLGDAQLADDLGREMTEILTSVCARRYGRRWAARKGGSGDDRGRGERVSRIKRGFPDRAGPEPAAA
jgi:hypothetical protein